MSTSSIQLSSLSRIYSNYLTQSKLINNLFIDSAEDQSKSSDTGVDLSFLSQISSFNNYVTGTIYQNGPNGTTNESPSSKKTGISRIGSALETLKSVDTFSTLSFTGSYIKFLLTNNPLDEPDNLDNNTYSKLSKLTDESIYKKVSSSYKNNSVANILSSLLDYSL